MRSIVSACIFAVVLSVQAGCGEPSQSVQYQDGRYAGKPDEPAWSGAEFDGNRENWERDIKRRNKLQSEYTRPGGA